MDIEIFWAGLLKGSGAALPIRPASTTETRDTFTIKYHRALGERVVTICADRTPIGFGLLCDSAADAQRQLVAVQALLQEMGIQSTAEAWRLFTIPNANA